MTLQSKSDRDRIRQRGARNKEAIDRMQQVMKRYREAALGATAAMAEFARILESMKGKR